MSIEPSGRHGLVRVALFPCPGDQLLTAARQKMILVDNSWVWAVEQSDVRDDDQVFDVGSPDQAGLVSHLVRDRVDPGDRLTVRERCAGWPVRTSRSW